MTEIYVHDQSTPYQSLHNNHRLQCLQKIELPLNKDFHKNGYQPNHLDQHVLYILQLPS